MRTLKHTQISIISKQLGKLRSPSFQYSLSQARLSITMATSPPLFLNEDQVRPLLSWDSLVPAIEKVMGEVSNKDRPAGSMLQPPRTIMGLPLHNNLPRVLLSMPGYSGENEALACKLVTVCGNNKNIGLPSIIGTILLFDAYTGKVQVIMEANDITAWRTAAASVVATKHLANGSKILAVLGTGVQGKIHTKALNHFHNFSEIRVWNHKKYGAVKLCTDLRNEGITAVVCDEAEDCVRDADIIVTATYATEPIVKGAWVKPGAHINAIGAGVNHHSELDVPLYQSAKIYTDSMDGAKVELKGLADYKVEILGEIGELVNGTLKADKECITIFHSLGMAVEDVVSAKLIHEEYKKKHGL